MLKLQGTYTATNDTTAQQLAEDGEHLQQLGTSVLGFIASDYCTRENGQMTNTLADGEALQAALHLIQMGSNCQQQAIKKLTA